MVDKTALLRQLQAAQHEQAERERLANEPKARIAAIQQQLAEVEQAERQQAADQAITQAAQTAGENPALAENLRKALDAVGDALDEIAKNQYSAVEDNFDRYQRQAEAAISRQNDVQPFNAVAASKASAGLEYDKRRAVDSEIEAMSYQRAVNESGAAWNRITANAVPLAPIAVLKQWLSRSPEDQRVLRAGVVFGLTQIQFTNLDGTYDAEAETTEFLRRTLLPTHR